MQVTYQFTVAAAVTCILALSQTRLADALDNGLALKPPLAWSTWLAFCPPDGSACRDYCSDDNLRKAADAMIDTGMKANGYDTIVISDCWASTKRDQDSQLPPDPSRFPNGMKPVVDYIHSKGLKAGLYTSVGTKTCVGDRPALQWPSCPHSNDTADLPCAETDLKTYASWGIDWIKVDNCFNDRDPRQVYATLESVVNKTGRPILINLCEWGVEEPWTWANSCGNSWRVTQDHTDEWSSTSTIISMQQGRSRWTGRPGGWNDLDMLMTGLAFQNQSHHFAPGQTKTEYITEFSFWALLQSPLVWTGDLLNITDFQKQVLFNKDVLAINQDVCPGSSQGDLLMVDESGAQIWGRENCNKSWTAILYNPSNSTAKMTLPFDLFGWSPSDTVLIKDLWTKHTGNATSQWTAPVEGHGVIMVTATRQ